MQNESVIESERKIKESIKDELTKLPSEYQQAISTSGWFRKCQKIGEKYYLSEAEIHNLKIEVALLILGLSDMDTFHEFLNTEIGGNQLENIEELIFDNILNPIGYVFDKLNNNEIHFPTHLYFDNIYTLDLPGLLARTSLSGKRKSTVSAQIFNYYDCILDTIFLNAFDILRIEIAWEEKDISIEHQDRSIGIMLLSKNRKLHRNQIAFVIDSIVQSCKMDGELRGTHSEFECKEFIEGNKEFLLLDHPNGHDIGIHRSDELGVYLDFSITYTEFLLYRQNTI